MSDRALCFSRPFVFLWKSSDSGRRRRPGGQLQPLQPKLGLPPLGLKVNEVESEVLGQQGAKHWELERHYSGHGAPGDSGKARLEKRCGYGACSTWMPFLLFPDSDDALLKMTISQQEFSRTGLPDLSSMTEEEQIAYAMQMSLQGAGEPDWLGGVGQRSSG